MKNKPKLKMFCPLKNTRACRRLALAALGLLLAGRPLDGSELKIELPPETVSFKPAPGLELANAQCLTCHSVDYVLTQPPEPLAFWAAEVKKMKKVYGAQIPDNEVEPLADYLARNYGTATNGEPSVAPAANPQPVSATTAPVSVETLATRYGCLNCHKVNVKVVGPAFKDVAAKYRNDPAAVDKIVHQIHTGGSGKWGPVIMPPFSMVSDTEAKMLARWIMSQDTGR
jgi:cytochrome c551/c552